MTTIVQEKYAEGLGSTSVSVTLDSAPTAGNLLVAVVTSNSGIGTAPVHPWGTGPDVFTTTGPVTHIYSRIAGASESATIAFSSSTIRNYTLSVIEVPTTPGKVWNGLDTSATANGSATSSLPLGPTGAQADSDDVAVAGVALNGASGTVPVWSASFTTVGSPTTGARGFAGYKVLSSTAAVSTTGSWTTARDTSGAVATYKQTAPLPPTGFIALL